MHHHHHHGHHHGGPPPMGTFTMAPTVTVGTFAPAYGAPPPMYSGPTVYANPAPVTVGYAGMPPPPPGFVIPSYTPGLYTYNTPYYRQQPFVIPYGMPPHLAAKMSQASATFRMFDTNYSGNLDKKEWKRALKYMNYHIPKGYAKHLFYTVDRDRSGRISEREFCEWWLATNPY